MTRELTEADRRLDQRFLQFVVTQRQAIEHVGHQNRPTTPKATFSSRQFRSGWRQTDAVDVIGWGFLLIEPVIPELL